jgi:hypothetical protein
MVISFLSFCEGIEHNHVVPVVDPDGVKRFAEAAVELLQGVHAWDEPRIDRRVSSRIDLDGFDVVVDPEEFYPCEQARLGVFVAACKVADYLRIWAAPRKLSANDSTLFANEGSEPVMSILNSTKSQAAGKV